jgi:hypothetical protein
MIIALYIIGSAAALVLLAARLREAQDELDRVREESGDRDRAVREDYSAYAHGVAVSLACLLAGLAAATWYTPPRPAGSGRAGARESAPEGAPDREAGR